MAIVLVQISLELLERSNQIILNENEESQNLILNYSLEFCHYPVLCCISIDVELYLKSHF